jgi:hypothetical protein
MVDQNVFLCWGFDTRALHDLDMKVKRLVDTISPIRQGAIDVEVLAVA